MNRPIWCPHSDCQFKCHSQEAICVGKLLERDPHGEDFNTHRVCFHGAKDDGEWTFDLKVNKSDCFNISRIINLVD